MRTSPQLRARWPTFEVLGGFSTSFGKRRRGEAGVILPPRPRSARAVISPEAFLQPGAGDDGGLPYRETRLEQVGVERLVQCVCCRGGQPGVDVLQQQQPR